MISKVWEVMNDLEMVTSKIVSAREIIDTAAEAIQRNEYDKAETLAMAAYEFLGYYLDEFDEKFKLAWQETVVKQNQNNYVSPWNHSNLETLKYSDEELNAMCDKAELDAEIERIRQEGGYDWTPNTKTDKVTKWILPVEECKDVDTDETEYFVSFPDDLLEAANLKEGDQIEWVDNGDGSYTIVKVTKPLEMDEC